MILERLINQDVVQEREIVLSEATPMGQNKKNVPEDSVHSISYSELRFNLNFTTKSLILAQDER